MQERNLPPHAASLIQSMRDIGYSLETAIADLIDNSITAGSSNIRIFLDVVDTINPCLTIIDNGSGMTEDELLEAMRPGSRNPREERDKNDLGRFGLGLKTASFSQCKSLTVVSRKNGSIFGARWDLDLISIRNEWIVTILSERDFADLTFIEELPIHGTYVLWQKLDRLIEKHGHDVSDHVYEKFAVVRNHLALVFHRYLSGTYNRRKLTIQINGDPIEPFDPFCISNKATQLLPEEIVRIDGHEVKIQPYILPHHSKLSKQEYDFYQTRGDFISNQGAYIYRNGRLMAWGDWFRLVPKSEATKLARVQIDFSNILDEYWTIDIKKSRAHPPYEVREKLKHIINKIADQSKRVHVGRGNRLFEEHDMPLWVRYSDRPRIRYEINRDHPLITGLKNLLDQSKQAVLGDILSVIEGSLPLEAIYSDYASKPQSFDESNEISDEQIRNKIQNLYTLVVLQGAMDKDSFIRMLLSLKPFNENMDTVQKFLEELDNG